MATYFHGNSEIQGDGLQTLVLMNRGFVGYSDAQQPPPTNFVFLNSAGNSPNPPTVSHAPPAQTQQLVGFPLHSAAAVHHQQDISSLQGSFAPRSHYNIHSSIDTMAARDFTRRPKGLSLSLSPQQTSTQWTGPMISPTAGDDVRVPGASPSSVSGVSNGVTGAVLQSGVLSPKYLKAAQELLCEVVNVGKAVKNWPPKRPEESPVSMRLAGEGASGGATSAAKPGELTTAERHEIQTKKAKLVNMLDEVERRYRQYHHQMQMVICWFEQVAGIGSAKPYTTLALQTISRQFRCLKDTLVEQIRATSKSLGEEEDGSRGGKAESSRLKFIHHQLRQQGALQHLGMIQPNAWRPQRGLPERAVSVLRAWLFEHFLHPYPKDTDKIMLAKQTGLTRSQVSNWFINARVRLWKPMVEEMYLEEVKEQEQNGSEERRSKGENNEDLAARKTGFKEDDDNTNQNPPPGISVSPSSTTPTEITIPNQSGFSLIRAPDTEVSPRKQSRTAILQSPSMAMHMNVKPGAEDDEQLAMSFNSGFGGYPIAEQFPATYSSNGVSLTLGLQHCESLSISGTHQPFLANQRRVEMDESNDQFGGINAVPSSSHSASLYEAMNLQNRKRFAAQLLHDFVA